LSIKPLSPAAPLPYSPTASINRRRGGSCEEENLLFSSSLFLSLLFLSLSLIEEEAAVVRRALYLVRGNGSNHLGCLRNAECMFQKGLPHNLKSQGPGISPV